jgi:hypothetical protein
MGKNMNKYHNKKIAIDGHIFDSIKEAKRYRELKLLMVAIGKDKIYNLKLQPKFLLQESFEKGGKKYKEINYIADFQYVNGANKIIIEDVKGMKTKEYLLKKKLFEYRYKILTITEI